MQRDGRLTPAGRLTAPAAPQGPTPFFRGEDKRSRTKSQPLPKILSCVYEREPLGWGGGHACRRCVWNVRTVQNYLLVAAIEDGERAGLEISRKG